MTDPTVLAAALVIGIAALIRGYSGFGFAMVGVAGLSIATPPIVAIPTVLILELIVGLLLLPPVWREISWRPVLTLLAGAVVLTPVGAILLIQLPENATRIALAVVIASAAIVLMRTPTVRPVTGTVSTVATGGVAGLLNGAFGISGPPVVLFFLNTQRGAAISRASMMACFLVLDLVAVMSFGVGGLIDRAVLVTVLWCLPALAVGSWLGHRAFHGSDTTKFRSRVLWLLIALALVTGARGLWAVLTG